MHSVGISQQPDLSVDVNREIYANSLITKIIVVPITHIGKNIKELIRQKLAKEIEGKCITDGYVQPNSIQIYNLSSGIIQSENVKFEAVFECKICLPVEGMIIECIAKNITKAGIRAELDMKDSPIVLFIARDHNYLTNEFSLVNENDKIKVRIIGKRFELNDTYISIIAQLI